MGFDESVGHVFLNAFNVSGRASRGEYWWFVLFCGVGRVITALFDGIFFPGMILSAPGDFAFVGSGVLGSIFALVILLPMLSVTVRRLHDIDRSGWWVLIFAIPVIGAFVLLWWVAKKGDEGPNSYGPEQGSDDINPAS